MSQRSRSTNKKTVKLANGKSLPYDRLVIAPGIDIKFDSVAGYSEAVSNIMPHAWKPGPQTRLLHGQLNALKDGALIVMITPPNPYRCPPGPYERASMMAHVLKAKGHKKSKIVIIDPKERFSKQALFVEGWQKHYPGMIEWQDPKMHGGVKNVDAKTKTVKTDLAEYKAQLVNVIPAQMAGKIARDAGLANQTGFCPINPENMQSTLDANIYVVGDACIPGDMPKSAFSANSQAKVAAMMIRGELAKSQTFPARYTNTCWSLIETDDTVKVGGTYAAKDGKIGAVEGLRVEDRRERGTAQADPGRRIWAGIRHHGRHFVMTDDRTKQQQHGDAERSASPRCSGGIGAAALAPALPAPSRAAVPPFRRRLGSFEVSVISDGTLNATLSFPLPDTPGQKPQTFRSARLAGGRPAAADQCHPRQYRQRDGPDRRRLRPEIPADRRKALRQSGSRRHRPQDASPSVVFTHAHADHLWGAIDDFDDGERFPNASYVIASAEWDFWTGPDAPCACRTALRGMARPRARILKQIEKKVERRNAGDTVAPGMTYSARPATRPAIWR